MHKVIGALVIGLALALLVISALDFAFQSKTYPEYPAALTQNYGTDLTAEQTAIQKDYDQKVATYDSTNRKNNKISFVLLNAACIILVAVGVLLLANFEVFGSGFLAGGLALVYTDYLRSSMIDDIRFRSITLLISLALVLGVFVLKYCCKFKLVTK